MTSEELEIQKIFVKVFEEIKAENEKSKSEMHRLGYKQRDELYKHVNSGYNNHEGLNKARMEFEQNGVQNRVRKWVYDLFIQHRDIFGYFENYEEIINQMDILIDRAIETEMYDIAQYLSNWRNKLNY